MNSTPRTLFVSLDAACWAYLDPLLSDGRLPALQHLIESGVHGVLRSPMPPMTPVAWSSLATGKGPGRHGVYEWVKRRPESYELSPFTLRDRAGTPIWRRLCEQGIRVGLVNVPLTYPPPDIEGFVLCGFGVPKLGGALTFPADLLGEIGQDPDTYDPVVDESLSPTKLLQAEQCLEDQQVEIGLRAAQRYAVDLLVVNLMLLDHANHYSPDYRYVEDAIVQADRHIARLLEGFSPDSTFLISDHGSRRISGCFLLGAWLRDHGYYPCTRSDKRRRDYLNWVLLETWERHLRKNGVFAKGLRRMVLDAWMHLPTALDRALWKTIGTQEFVRRYVNWPAPSQSPEAALVYTNANSGCLYVNLVGREPDGKVQSEDCGDVIQGLREELLAIPDPTTGKGLFADVIPGKDLYPGAALGQPPDLVTDHYSTEWGLSWVEAPPAVPQEGYFVRDIYGWYGEHSRDGIFVFAGSDIEPAKDRRTASLLDVPATLLYLYDVAVPEDYDGRVMTGVFNPSYTSTHRVTYQPADDMTAIEPSGKCSSSETEDLWRRLKLLGYV